MEDGIGFTEYSTPILTASPEGARDWCPAASTR
jgi:aspartyl-tRNA synthetase